MNAKSLAVMMLLTISACALGTKKEEVPGPALASVASPAPSSTPAEAAAASTDRIWVVKPDGSRQCEPESGRSLESAAAPLNGANIQIFDSRKGKDGKIRAQMCGMPTGRLNGYLISIADLMRARQLGFVEAPAGFATQGK